MYIVQVIVLIENFIFSFNTNFLQFYVFITGSGYKELVLTRKEVFLIISEHLSDKFASLIEFMVEKISKDTGRTVVVPEDSKQTFSILFNQMRTRWQQAHRKSCVFFKNNGEWLSKQVCFAAPTDTVVTSPGNTGGRPSLEFTMSSERSKRRKTQDIRTSFNSVELAYATQMSLRSSGQSDAAKVIKDVTMTSPLRASKYRKAYSATDEITLSEEAALSAMIEYKFSKSTYQGMRRLGKENNCKLYPSYEKVMKAKKRCYPPRDAIRITESSAEVQLQALLDHTVERILLVQNVLIQRLTPDNVRKMDLICKWGCDGSSGQSEYKQTFSDDSKSDAHVFFTSVVPLQLVCYDQQSKEEIVVWKNPRPSSPRFCRPLRLLFLREDTESTLNEVQIVEEQIKSLRPFESVIDGKEISVMYKLLFTMIDGKVCNAVSLTKSAQRCYLCGATSKDFNAIDTVLQREINETNLKFGLSTLHAWIRCFEYCLHVSYKLGIKKWQARSAEEKKITQERKRAIQEGFKKQLGLNIDRPKPGYGSSNDGNTARRFFENSTVSAAITGVNEEVIKRLYVILQVISCGHEINCERFEQYAIETARKTVALYPWYSMPTSVHKLLIHGPVIITHALLPIGQLSEDAQEARNKDIKRYREDFARKSSRVKTMEDVFHRLLVTSDPYISSVRRLPQKKLKSLSPEAVAMLIAPKVTAAADEFCAEIEAVPGVVIDTNSDNDSDSDSDSDYDFD